MNILLFGPPGAGKGTQSAFLVEGLGMAHVSTGDLFRQAIKNQTVLGKEAKSYLDKGSLVPDSVTIGLVEEVLENLAGVGFILDGFPRNVSQAEALEEILTQKDLELDRCIFLSLDQNRLAARLTGRRVCKSCGKTFHIESKPTKVEGLCDGCGGPVIQRSDDHADVIENRLKTYNESTAPLREFYQKKGVLVEVDGEGTPEEVYSRLVKIIKA